MKQKIFTLMILLALVVAGGKAFAFNEIVVLGGSTYHYKLEGVATTKAATATVTYALSTGGVTNPTIVQNGGGVYNKPINTTGDSISFNVTYGTQALPADDGTITVTLDDGTCSNSIELDINVVAPPTITLAITTTGSTGCQQRRAADHNVNRATTGGDATLTNTFSYTVTPVVTFDPAYITANGAVTYNWSYDVTLPVAGGLSTYDITGGPVAVSGTVNHTGASSTTNPSADVYTVTFYTTTGIGDVTQAASIDIPNSELVIPGVGTYVASLTTGGSSSQSITVNAVPAIGTFVLPTP